MSVCAAGGELSQVQQRAHGRSTGHNNRLCISVTQRYTSACIHRASHAGLCAEDGIGTAMATPQHCSSSPNSQPASSYGEDFASMSGTLQRLVCSGIDLRTASALRCYAQTNNRVSSTFGKQPYTPWVDWPAKSIILRRLPHRTCLGWARESGQKSRTGNKTGLRCNDPCSKSTCAEGALRCFATALRRGHSRLCELEHKRHVVEA